MDKRTILQYILAFDCIVRYPKDEDSKEDVELWLHANSKVY